MHAVANVTGCTATCRRTRHEVMMAGPSLQQPQICPPAANTALHVAQKTCQRGPAVRASPMMRCAQIELCTKKEKEKATRESRRTEGLWPRALAADQVGRMGAAGAGRGVGALGCSHTSSSEFQPITRYREALAVRK